MIELKNDALRFSFPDVHPSASLAIDFQRTLRIPDNDEDYSLPPGLGRFPLRHVDDFAARLPAAWIEHGGVMLPMHQAEAMWIHFETHTDPEREAECPFAIRIAAGKINAVTGQAWIKDLYRKPQDYVVAPGQPWLDGFCVTKGTIRQFVAMPLGAGYTTEEQITGEAPPTKAPTAAEYTAAGLPWFDYYGEGTALAGSPILAGLESVAQMGKKKGETPLPENEPVHGETIVKLRAGLAKGQVREGRF